MIIDESLVNYNSLFMKLFDQFSFKSLTLPARGDACVACEKKDKQGNLVGSINVEQSVELGHLFVLGDHYSKQLGLQVKNVPVQMGYLVESVGFME